MVELGTIIEISPIRHSKLIRYEVILPDITYDTLFNGFTPRPPPLGVSPWTGFTPGGGPKVKIFPI